MKSRDRDLLAAMGRFLRSRREEMLFSQGEVAKSIGVSSAYLSDVERGNRSLSLPRARLLCSALQIPIGALYTYSYGYLLEALREVLEREPNLLRRFSDLLEELDEKVEDG